MKTILVVEDEHDLLAATKMILEDEGYDVIACAGGKEALACLEQRPRPDLVLMDVMMPVVNGFEVLAAVQAKEQLRSMPVVLMSAVDLGRLPDQTPSVNWRAFLGKPFTLERLLETVIQYVGPARPCGNGP